MSKHTPMYHAMVGGICCDTNAVAEAEAIVRQAFADVISEMISEVTS